MQIAPATNRISGAAKFEPYSTGHKGCQPPRNSKVAMEQTVTMLAYSAMKNDANVMLLYSTWKPATNSFSASGRSNGMRLVSANAEIMKMTKLNICGNGPAKINHLGRIPKLYPAWELTISRRLSVPAIRSGEAIARLIGSS